jgi:hypothetical protein
LLSIGFLAKKGFLLEFKTHECYIRNLTSKQSPLPSEAQRTVSISCEVKPSPIAQNFFPAQLISHRKL